MDSESTILPLDDPAILIFAEMEKIFEPLDFCFPSDAYSIMAYFGMKFKLFERILDDGKKVWIYV